MDRLLVLVVVVLVFGALPLVVRRSERVLHLLVALATGVFLGVVFLHLLPELAHGVAATAGDDPAADHGHGHAGSLVWPCVLVGVLALFVLENLVLRRSSDRHVTVSWASLTGLGLHSFLTGVGLAAAAATSDLDSPVYMSLLTHKAPEAFSLGTVFLLAGYSRRRILAVVGAFSLVTPAGALVGGLLVDGLPEGALLVVLALATGTFLFVALCDLLPEVFHHAEDGGWKVLLVVLGIALSTALDGLFGA